jgi:hypothetical protein
MNFKYIIQFLENDGTIKSEVQIKTLRDLEKMLNIEYHQCRQLYLLNKKKTKRAHPFLLELFKKVKIIDNPNLFSSLEILN